jgi:DNA ligase 1
MNFPTLYARTSTGAVQTWRMERDGDKYRSISGQKNGQKVESEWTTAKPKNVGKSNATTAEEQAENEIKNKYKKQLSQGGYWEKEEDIDKFRYFEPQLAHKWEDYSDKIDWITGAFVSPKLDGLRCIITKDGCFSRQGKKFASFPHIFKKLEPQFKQNPSLILDGEIYTHKFKSDFNKIISLAKKSKPTEEDFIESEKYLQYWIFDMPSLDEPYYKRYSAIKDLVFQNFYKDPHIILCGHKVVHSLEELRAAFDDYILNGFEGLMVNVYDGEYEQKRSKNILKYKEFIDEEFEILSIREGDGNRSGMFGAAMLKTKDGKTFESNARGNEDFYRSLLRDKDELVGKFATVRYQNLTPDGIPRFPVVVAIRDYD